MTRRLILMRHAKSSWADLSLPDHDRPLNKRGRKSARALGKWLHSQGHLPDEVLSSTSLRTRETCAGLHLSCPVTWLKDLYHASPETILTALKQAKGQTVLMLGHNPGFGALAQQLPKQPPQHPRFADYPTGATLVIQFDIQDWSALTPHSGTVQDFVIPRELLDT